MRKASGRRKASASREVKRQRPPSVYENINMHEVPELPPLRRSARPEEDLKRKFESYRE